MSNVEHFKSASTGAIFAITVNDYNEVLAEQIEKGQLVKVDSNDVVEVKVGKRGVRLELKSEQGARSKQRSKAKEAVAEPVGEDAPVADAEPETEDAPADTEPAVDDASTGKNKNK